MDIEPKTSQLQVRVTPAQKRTLKLLAKRDGMDVSNWVLRRIFPDESLEFQRRTEALALRAEPRIALAELADYLGSLPPGAFARAVAEEPRARLEAGILNYLAGAIELALTRRGLQLPAWTARVPHPPDPVFGSQLGAVRLHLLTHTPVAFRRRNLFIDASIDDRV